MNDQDRPHSRSSFAWQDRGFRQQAPASLRHSYMGNAFDHARNPWLRRQQKAERQSETQRRETGDGSNMVNLHKPFPELRPKHDRSQIRQSFNRDWLREARDAQMKQFDAQAKHLSLENPQDLEHQYCGPLQSRSR